MRVWTNADDIFLKRPSSLCSRPSFLRKQGRKLMPGGLLYCALYAIHIKNNTRQNDLNRPSTFEIRKHCAEPHILKRAPFTPAALQRHYFSSIIETRLACRGPCVVSSFGIPSQHVHLFAFPAPRLRFSALACKNHAV